MDIVYIETSIVSYATAWPSQITQIAALQQQAKDWWRLERPSFELVTSQLTINEAAAGDPSAAADRLSLLTGLPLLTISKDAEDLAAKILAGHMMPHKAAADALHVAVAALARVNYLLTLNCTHIANAQASPCLQTIEQRGAGWDVDLHSRGVPGRKRFMKDPILEELHRTRERLLEESGGTLASLVSRLEQDQLKSGRELRATARTKDAAEADDRPQSEGSSVSSAR